MYLEEFPSLTLGLDGHEEQWDAVPRGLYTTLEALSQERIPNRKYTLDDLEGLIKSLVQKQRGPGRFLVWGGSWSLIDIDEPAPSDVRVDFIFFPTYMVVSIMSLFWRRFPERAASIPGFQAALHNGCHFASARELQGHGMEGDDQRMEAMRILNMGKVPQYLAEHVDEHPKCRPLYDALIQCKEEIRKRICGIPGTLLSLHQALSILPGKSEWKSESDFIWKMQEGETYNCAVLVESPYSNPPKEERDTDTIANEVARRTGAACILGRQSRQLACYTSWPNEENTHLVTRYRSIVKDIFKKAEVINANGEAFLPILHIVVRGIKDRYGLDVEIGTRNGRSCSERVAEQAKDILRTAIERNRGQWKRCAIGVDTLFHGGSKYLELNRNGDDTFQGLGENYQALEIRLSRGSRKTYRNEIIEGLCALTEIYRKG